MAAPQLLALKDLEVLTVSAGVTVAVELILLRNVTGQVGKIHLCYLLFNIILCFFYINSGSFFTMSLMRSYIRTHCIMAVYLVGPVTEGPTTPAPTTRPTVQCENKRRNCPNWAAAGYCTGRYESYMSENCAQSCGTCASKFALLSYTNTCVYGLAYTHLYAHKYVYMHMYHEVSGWRSWKRLELSITLLYHNASLRIENRVTSNLSFLLYPGSIAKMQS